MVTDGKITAPVGLASTANFFGVASDVMTVCQASAINKWAKYKPIALTSMGKTDTPASLTEAQRKAADYGLVVTTATSSGKTGLPTAFKAVTGSNAAWAYKARTAGTDYARLDDFVGYDNATSPICETSTLGDNYKTDTVADLTLWFTNSSTAHINFNELGSFGTLGNCYLCFAFQYGSAWYYIFSDGTVDEIVTAGDGWSGEQPGVSLPVITNPLVAPFSSIPAGKTVSFTGYLFLIDLARALGTVPSSYKGGCISETTLTDTNYNVYSLPLVDAVDTMNTFTVQHPAAATYLDYDYTISVGTITTVTITVKNETSSATTIQNLFIYLTAYDVKISDDYSDVMTRIDEWQDSGAKYTSGISFSGSMGTGVYAKYGAAISGSYAIAAKSTRTFTITFDTEYDDFGNFYDEDAGVAVCAQDSLSGRTINGNY